MIRFFSILAFIFLLCSCNKKEDPLESDFSNENGGSYNNTHILDSIINACYDNGTFNGTVLVSDNKKVVYRRAFGYANRETKEMLIPESVFYLASVSKQFTAMAIMILNERNKLSYDDKLIKYFSEFQSYAGMVTIRHLLTHTSGIPDYFGLNIYKTDLKNRDVFEALIKLESLDFMPGSMYEYSNSGYVLLAMITEKVSGIPFHEFMKENIFYPLGMTNTMVYDESKPIIKNRVIGYNGDGSPNDYRILTSGAGGMFSNLDDLFLWDQALYANDLVSYTARYEAFSPMILNNGDKSNYGFGWLILDNEMGRIVRHSGSLFGFRTHITRDLTGKDAYIILSNNGDAFDMNTIIGAIKAFLNPSVGS